MAVLVGRAAEASVPHRAGRVAGQVAMGRMVATAVDLVVVGAVGREPL